MFVPVVVEGCANPPNAPNGLDAVFACAGLACIVKPRPPLLPPRVEPPNPPPPPNGFPAVVLPKNPPPAGLFCPNSPNPPPALLFWAPKRLLPVVFVPSVRPVAVPPAPWLAPGWPNAPKPVLVVAGLLLPKRLAPNPPVAVLAC